MNRRPRPLQRSAQRQSAVPEHDNRQETPPDNEYRSPADYARPMIASDGA